MVGSGLTLSLLGLGAVYALPAANTVEERQGVWGIGEGSGTFEPGSGVPTCLTNVPLSEQPPCMLPPISSGGFIPPKEKRDVIGVVSETVQARSFSLPPDYATNTKKVIETLELELIKLQNKRNKTAEDRSDIKAIKAALQYLAGITSISAPPGTGSTFTPGKRAFTLPPDAATNPKAAIETLEAELVKLQNKKVKTAEDKADIKAIKAALQYLAGITSVTAPPGTGSSFTPGKRAFYLPPDAYNNPKAAIEALELQLEELQNKKWKSAEDKDDIKAIKAALQYLAGITSITAPPGTGSTFTPGKRAFYLPPDASTNPKAAIEQLELQLEALQNKKWKSAEDKADIKAIKSALQYLAGITSITAPPGTGSTFTPGKRSFSLPPDAATNPKAAIEELERELIELQNKPHKSAADRADIKAIKAALQYLAGIVSISAPPGTGSTFTPGKRDSFSLGSDGAYASQCPNLDGAELAYETLIQKPHLSVQEYLIAQRLKHFLAGCGITIVKSPPGTSTTIKPSDKRDTAVLIEAADFDLAGLEAAYRILSEAVASTQPSFATWLSLQQIADLLEIYGVPVEFVPEENSDIVPTKRQTIGGKACQLSDIIGLKAALVALLTAYGDPSKAPTNIYLIEQVIVTALQICGQSVSGWTTLTPGNPIPGGPIKPDPYVPGGAITPDPTVPGGPITPDPYIPGGPMKPSDKRQILGPIEGGTIKPEPYIPGGPIKPSDKRQVLGPIEGGTVEPEPTVPGGPIEPSDKREINLSDGTALLAALHQLESKYGSYGSSTIPVPIYLIMVNMVTVLQKIPGVAVPGWPILFEASP